MLDIIQVSKTFNRNTVNENRALTSLSLSLNDGDFVTVIGGNGSGKSTMLNAVAGVLSVDSGQIFIDENEVTSLAEHRRAPYIGRVFQDPMMGTAAGMSIEENLALARRRGQRRGLRWGLPKRDRDFYREKLKELELGLEDRLTVKTGLLSGGQRQALTLLMATLNKPRLLLLDEHTAALDPKTARTVLDLTEKMVARHAITTLMVTHNMKDAITLGNRLVMFHAGRIVIDVKGESKKELTVEKLLSMFEKISAFEDFDDKLLLS
ncbi:MAG: ATP-binding cassette domain-containing protein [Clostridiaceae bacterium]|nr:ATP-binding cassette domain-containing protein [Clostridiaceae bacterium]